ncbi:MarR family transcriptional regulator [Variovorax sp. LjRoot84]|uniref:MarR family winged helix-turn-helix transcriptional regulator n=1 Tax=Variovorax sp. LjRoot84 TaxID=3342340 RepID=UPI003ECEC0CF
MRSNQVKSTLGSAPEPKTPRYNRRAAEAAALPPQQSAKETTKAISAPYQVTQQVGHLLRRAYQRHIALFQQGIPDSQLTMPQFVTLCAVGDLGSCSLNEIVAQTSIDQATIRGVVERLSSRELLAIAEHVSDKRKLSISLTPKGHQFLREMIAMAEGITEQTFGALNTAERVALVYLLEKMCASSDGEP